MKPSSSCIFFAFLLNLSTLGQDSLDVSVLEALDARINLKGLCFLSEQYAHNDDLIDSHLHDWNANRFPDFFELIDEQPEVIDLLIKLDSTSAKIATELRGGHRGEQFTVIAGEYLDQFHAAGNFDWHRYHEEALCPTGFFQISATLTTSDRKWMVLKLARYEGHLMADCWLAVLKAVNDTWILEAYLLLWLS